MIRARGNVKVAAKVKNCPLCGRIYVETGRKMCRDCYEEQAVLEMEVMSYVRDHPGATAQEVIEATGVDESVLRRLIREGRFEETNLQLDYPCARCGKPIIKGKFCQDCLMRLHNKLQRTKKELKLKQVDVKEHARRVFMVEQQEEEKKAPVRKKS